MEDKTRKTCNKFLETLKVTGNVAKSCRAVNRSRQWAYDTANNYPEFKQEWEDAMEEATDALEAEGRRRAFGFEEPVVVGGKPVTDDEGNPVVVKKYSDTLLIFLLKGQREKYKDRPKNDENQNVQPVVNVNLADVIDKPEPTS